MFHFPSSLGTHGTLPALAFQVVQLQVCATMHGLKVFFKLSSP